jgi:hypothetical protein
MKALLATVLLLTSAVAQAAPLTVRTGETWLFSISRGQPVKTRKVEATTATPRGQVKVSVRAAFGTMMTITNNSAQGYTFDAQLIDAAGKAVNARSCTLPPNNQPALENWPQKAAAVRIGNFKPAKGGNC